MPIDLLRALLENQPLTRDCTARVEVCGVGEARGLALTLFTKRVRSRAVTLGQGPCKIPRRSLEVQTRHPAPSHLRIVLVRFPTLLSGTLLLACACARKEAAPAADSTRLPPSLRGFRLPKASAPRSRFSGMLNSRSGSSPTLTAP
jgi:hypothetical protein